MLQGIANPSTPERSSSRTGRRFTQAVSISPQTTPSPRKTTLGVHKTANPISRPAGKATAKGGRLLRRPHHVAHVRNDIAGQSGRHSTDLSTNHGIETSHAIA